MGTAIKVENVGKLYRLGEVSTGTVGHDLNRWWAKMRGKGDIYKKIGDTNDREKHGESDLVWAVKDISFEVKQGEVLGIIGRNGAGKSTLLKLLSKVTAPTEGNIKIRGRIASLLEVGTGFHPELTGRENVFLNGAILGMKKVEIRKKFDEIVEFSGVQRYIDTPVKRYSSGMYVRLAFAVAAFLEPEILIIDEVLAVGDAEFQRKCLGRMKDVSVNDGRTVLFVSHHMASVAQLCNKSLLLHNGSVEMYDNTAVVIDKYLSLGQSSKSSVYKHGEDDIHKDAFIRSMEMLDEHERNIDVITHEDKFSAKIVLQVNTWNSDMELSISLQDKFNKRIFTINKFLSEIMPSDETGKTVMFEFPSNFIVPGKYSWLVSLMITGNSLIDVQWEICHFSIIDAGSEFAKHDGSDYGYIFANSYKMTAY